MHINLQKLILNNFLSYKHCEIDLTKKGITLIQGESGSGKSALLEAIVYIIYGKTIRKKYSINDLANKLINEGFDITLELTIDKNYYKIQEVRNNKTSQIFVHVNGECIQEKKKEDNRKIIQNAIGLSAEEFANIVVLGQGQIQHLVEGTPTERLALLSRLFNLNNYDLYLDNCDKDIKRMIGIKDAAIAKLDYMKLDMEAMKENIKEVTPVTYDLDELANIEADIYNKFSVAKRFKDKKEAFIRLDVLQQKYNNVQNYVRYNKSKDVLDTLNKRMYKISNELKSLDIIIKKSTSEDSSNVCPISKQDCSINIPIQYKNNIIENTTNKIRKIKQISKALAYRKNKHTKLFDKYTKYLKINDELKKQQEIVNAIKDDSISLEIAQIDDTIQNYTNELQDIKSKKDQAYRYQSQVKSNNQLKELLAKKEEEYKKLEDDLAKYTIYLQFANSSYDVLKKLKFVKLDKILSYLTYEVNNVLNKIASEYSIQFLSTKETITTKKVVDEINLVVYNNGMHLNANMLSGGQKTIVSIATMIGIINTIYKFSSIRINNLFLDEPFNTLSSIIEPVFEYISDLSKKLDIGIKIISHRELNNQLIDTVWDVERVNGISNIST